MENCTLQASFPKLDVILAASGEGEEILAVLECLFLNQKLLSCDKFQHVYDSVGIRSSNYTG